ncbi:DUF924 family protein [Parvularcula sp. LCG005]|uniref:DUF924 family protein n=1 Tax=Parvularcula sp. LCG005 TaxID=3078805 RepID=UPI002942EE14|nr:DUF924 family protein [Parvularcula sp. LCG005]WOI52568.1 DUF924 family protein [Parvularcula sp. LCG005]
MSKPAITITPIDGLTIARRGTAILAASQNALSLHEGDLSPVTYFPRANIWAGLHLPTTSRTHCPHKGDAAYFDAAGEHDGAWIYYDPKDKVAAIADHVAYVREVAAVETIALPELDPDAKAIIDYWFDEIPPAKQFQEDATIDATIKERFGAHHARAAGGHLSRWQNHPVGALALLILLDQFSRNLNRGSEKAFAHDAQARKIAGLMIQRGFDLALPAAQRAFVYIPFMHSEELDDQNTAVSLFEDRLPGSPNMAYALSHRHDIHRHGRFPYRDEALGR